MRNREFWLSVGSEKDRKKPRGRIGPVRVALLFGTMSVAVALLLPPVLHHDTRFSSHPYGIDTMATGSIPANANGTRQYVVRRSVTQETGTVCIINVGDAADRC